VVISGKDMAMYTHRLELSTFIFGDESSTLEKPTGYEGKHTFTQKSTRVGLDLVVQPTFSIRKTKIVCTMGPKCWDEENLGKLLDAGMNIARFNFSHGSHEAHFEVLERYRKVVEAKKSTAACLLDTKGPEIRTAMLKDHQNIKLEKNQDIFVEAVGDQYTEFEGYKNDTETRIGLSYAKLCQSVKVGGRILIADGSIVIVVKEMVSDTVLKGTVLNSKELGERKNCNLPGVQVEIPVLTEKDIDDLQNFCCKHKMDYVAASFVQSGADVDFIRKTLDDAGGQNVKIISKIENEAGLENIDDIIAKSDGIMVARGDLGMEIPSEKVALAQKMIITKCNIAGTFVITATQMLESMCANPLPTRAEMTDVANAVFDGTDAVMLSGETANGAFPEAAVQTMAAIAANAELVNNYYALYSFIRDFTPKPFTPEESLASSAAKAVLDCNASLCIVITTDGVNSNLVSKYRPSVPVVVLTSTDWVAKQANGHFGQYACKLDEVSPMLDPNSMKAGGAIDRGIQFAKSHKLLRDGPSDVIIIAEDTNGAIGISHYHVQ
jgi:pyruvate kinase